MAIYPACAPRSTASWPTCRSTIASSRPKVAPKRLLIADMDSTIIGCECLDELADFAGVKAEVSEITERAMRGELEFEGALRERVAMLKGLDLTALQRCYDERVRLNPGARAAGPHHGRQRRPLSAGLRRLCLLHQPGGRRRGDSMKTGPTPCWRSARP